MEKMDNRPLRIQIAQRLRFLFGLGGIAIDDFVLVNDRAAQEARLPVIVIDDYFQHEGADVVIVSEETKDQTVRVIEPGAIKFAMSSARQLPNLSRAKIAAGNRGYHLAVGGLYPRSVQISELEDLHGATCLIDSQRTGLPRESATHHPANPNSFFLLSSPMSDRTTKARRLALCPVIHGQRPASLETQFRRALDVAAVWGWPHNTKALRFVFRVYIKRTVSELVLYW